MVRYLASNVASRNQQSFLKSVHKWIYYSDFKKIDFSRKPDWHKKIHWVTSKDRFFDQYSKSWEGGLFQLTSEIERDKAVTVIYHTFTSPVNFIRIEFFLNLQNAEFQYFLGID